MLINFHKNTGRVLGFALDTVAEFFRLFGAIVFGTLGYMIVLIYLFGAVPPVNPLAGIAIACLIVSINRIRKRR